MVAGRPENIGLGSPRPKHALESNDHDYAEILLASLSVMRASNPQRKKSNFIRGANSFFFFVCQVKL